VENYSLNITDVNLRSGRVKILPAVYAMFPQPDKTRATV
jgi:hypothetical protein